MIKKLFEVRHFRFCAVVNFPYNMPWGLLIPESCQCLKAFPGCYLDQMNSIIVGFTMASVSLVASYPVAIALWRFIGRVKLLFASFVLMTSLIVVMLYSGSMSRVWAIYCVACLWSVCDCCLHIGITGKCTCNWQTIDQSLDKCA